MHITKHSLSLIFFFSSCTTSLLAATFDVDAARHIDKCNHVNTSALTLFPLHLHMQQPLMMSTLSCCAWIFLSSQERDTGNKGCTYNVNLTNLNKKKIIQIKAKDGTRESKGEREREWKFLFIILSSFFYNSLDKTNTNIFVFILVPS